MIMDKNWWQTLLEAIFKNRLISRKSLTAIAFGVMIYYVGLPLGSLAEIITEGPSKPTELAVLPEAYQYYGSLVVMLTKVVVLGILGWYTVKSQKDLDVMNYNGSKTP